MSLRWSSAALSFVILLGSLCAQQTVITPDSPVNAELLHQWLHSGDPRLIAWAADFARRTHDDKLIAELPGFLERNLAPPTGSGEGPLLQGLSLLVVLDTLIQAKAVVSIGAIQVIARTFPTHALLLIRNLPMAEARPILTYWSAETPGDESAAAAARVATMLLARDDPEPGLVSTVVIASEEELRVVIVASDGTGSINGVRRGMACASYSTSHTAGWPLAYSYKLAENIPDAGALQLIDLDGDVITAQRFDSGRGPPSCGSIAPLNPQTRHRLIAHWLGLQDADVPWQASESGFIAWSNYTEYEQKLGALIDAHRQILHATVAALHQRGFLTGDLGATTSPRLIVTFECSMKPCPLP